MKIFLSLFNIVLLLTSCNKNKEIEGVWIKAYEITEESNRYQTPIIFEFNQNDFNYRSIDVYELNKDSGKYNFENGLVYTQFENYKDTFSVDLISKDSLIVGNDEQKLVFKKVTTKTNINKEDLIGNLYHIKGKYYEDTIEFLNKDIYLTINDNKAHKYRWELVNYKNYNFICFGDFYQTSFFIEEMEPSCNLKTKIFYEEELIYDFKKLNLPKLNKILLKGKWNFEKRCMADKKAPPPPPGSNPTYIFDRNSMQIANYDTLTLESNFELNSTNEFIFFSKNLNPWKIIELTEDRLKIEIIKNTSTNSKNDTLEFWKQ